MPSHCPVDISYVSHPHVLQEPFGSVYCYTADGLMKRVDTGYKFPNGIAVQYSKDGQNVTNIIVAETGTKTLWAIPVTDGPSASVDINRKNAFGRCPGTCVSLIFCGSAMVPSLYSVPLTIFLVNLLLLLILVVCKIYYDAKLCLIDLMVAPMIL